MIKKVYRKIQKSFFSSHAGDQNKTRVFPPDFSEENCKIIQLVESFTMTSTERINELLRATEYILQNNIEGSIVECGVWRGGSMMAVALKLIQSNTERNLYCFDTFEGMSDPTDQDISSFGDNASHYLKNNQKSETDPIWAYSPLETVRSNLESTGFPMDKIHFIRGKVEDTLPNDSIKRIALLRLDTDWYESTKHELIHLFPLLAKGGVIIIDDYGHWEGAKKAVDEYFLINKIPIFLARVDYTGRIGIKLND